jgi:2-polyprenyl-3-methyl-5-hydroxy-6-metoxy-1,4-benzoquinol methylase
VCLQTDSVVDRVLSASTLVDSWRRSFAIDVSDYLQGVGSFELRRCQGCHAQFFSPPVAGDEALYAALERFDWYYMPRKWEHDIALGDILEGDRVLEVGSGRGHFVDRVRSAVSRDVLGIEMNSSAVREAKARGSPVRIATLSDLIGEHDASFDVVCSFQVLEHLSDPHAFLRDSVRLLRPGGRLLVGVPNADSFIKDQWNPLDMPPHHVTRWSRSALVQIARIWGLEVRRIELEPLAKYHVGGYVDVLLERAKRGDCSRALRGPIARTLLEQLLYRTPLRRMCTGQTIYCSYRLPCASYR